MKLHTTAISPNCRKAEATIYHLGLDVEIITKDLLGGELSKEDFLQINPNGKVPVLEDGDFKLWESCAIMQYLSDKANAEEFFPQAIKERTNMVRWQFWGGLHYNRAVATITWETVAKPAMQLGETIQEKVDSALDDFHFFANVLNKQLTNRSFITGNIPTLADFSVGDYSTFVLNSNSQIPLEKYPNVKAWYLGLEELDAWAKTRPSF